jgi:hypothetical protein
MNLIQVQDRLKDMPTQAIMSYANGSNPDVPPYLALGELNRRKQMEQKQVQAPQGTVKDQIEQSVKLAQAQKAAQAQGQQKMTEAMGAQQTPVPGGTPQPQEQPEAGIAQLPTGPMNFRDGGIVSFADNPDQPVGQNMPSDEEEKDRRRSADRRALATIPAFLLDEIQAPVRGAANVLGASASGVQNFANRVVNALAGTNLAENLDYNPNIKLRPLREKRDQPASSDLETSRYRPEGTDRPSESASAVKAMIEGTQLGQAPGAQRGSGPRPPSAGGGRAPGGAPQAGGPPVAVDPYAELMQQVKGQTVQLPKNPDELRAERAKTDPYLNTLPGSKLEELHAKIAQRDEEDRATFLKNEELRKQGRLNRGLMAGAEATRGQGGLGALGSFFMGFNKANEAEDESAMSRMDAQRKLERQQEVLRAEVLSKVEDARIARSEGQFKEAAGYEKDAANAQNQLSQLKLTQLTSLAQAVETRRHNIATEEGQREQLRYTRMAAAKGPEIEQVFNFLAKQFPDKDPAALLEMAVKNTRPGIAGDAAANTKLIGAEADIRKKYAGQKSVLTGNALAKIVALEKQEIEDLRRSAQGIGGLDASDPNAGFTIKSVK